MGTSTAFDQRTGRWVLDCWQCSNTGGVRRRRCPAGYCPSAQLCAGCYAQVKADGQWGEWHKDCQRHHDEYQAREAAKDAQPDQWVRAAWGTWYTHTGDILCLTRAGGWVLVPDGNYNPNVPVREMVGARPWTPDTGIEVPA